MYFMFHFVFRTTILNGLKRVSVVYVCVVLTLIVMSFSKVKCLPQIPIKFTLLAAAASVLKPVPFVMSKSTSKAPKGGTYSHLLAQLVLHQALLACSLFILPIGVSGT